jgi:hypothetical protein
VDWRAQSERKRIASTRTGAFRADPAYARTADRLMPTSMALGVPVALAVARFRISRLRRVNPRVIGLAGPEGLTPVMLTSDGWYHGSLVEVELSCGRVLDVTSPLVEVTTYLDGDDGLPPLEAEIARRERQDAAIRRRDWAEITGGCYPDDEQTASKLAVNTRERDVYICDQHQTVRVVEYHHYQAFRFRYDTLTVRVVFRYPRPELPRFEFAPSLEPYFQGYRKFILGLLSWEPST